MCSTPKAIWTALWKSMFLYHPGNTALKALVLKQTECFISLIAIAQKTLGRPEESAARIARSLASMYLLALSCFLNRISLKSGFILLSRPVPRSNSFDSPTLTLNDLTLGIRLKLLSKILPPLCALEVTRSLTMAETRESTSLNFSKLSFIFSSYRDCILYREALLSPLKAPNTQSGRSLPLLLGYLPEKKFQSAGKKGLSAGQVNFYLTPVLFTTLPNRKERRLEQRRT